MKRPVAFYMLLIMASIFLFFFLNLVLGSVSIPLRAVWNILWGTGNDKQTGTFYIQSEIPCVCISQQQKIQCFDKQEGKWQQYHHDTYK